MHYILYNIHGDLALEIRRSKSYCNDTFEWLNRRRDKHAQDDTVQRTPVPIHFSLNRRGCQSSDGIQIVTCPRHPTQRCLSVLFPANGVTERIADASQGIEYTAYILYTLW